MATCLHMPGIGDAERFILKVTQKGAAGILKLTHREQHRTGR